MLTRLSVQVDFQTTFHDRLNGPAFRLRFLLKAFHKGDRRRVKISISGSLVMGRSLLWNR